MSFLAFFYGREKLVILSVHFFSPQLQLFLMDVSSFPFTMCWELLTQGKKNNIQQVSYKCHIFLWWKRLTLWILIAVLWKLLHRVLFKIFLNKSQAVHTLPARECKQICFSGFPLSNQPPAELHYLRWNVSGTESNNYSCLAVCWE